jgi:hypothetical protein
MKEQSVFYLISELARRENVSCILIGGFAVNYYKVTRQTADIDFLITKEDFEKILASLEKAGYKQVSAQENFIQLKSDRFSLMNIDFMFVDKETLTKILKDGKEIKIANQKFIVPSLSHLIALKLHSIKHNLKARLIADLPDIISLIKINKVDIHSNTFKELCLKYGTEEIYQKIKEVLK